MLIPILGQFHSTKYPGRPLHASHRRRSRPVEGPTPGDNLAVAPQPSVKTTVKQTDEKKGFSAKQDDSTVEVPDGQVVELGADGAPVRDGDWQAPHTARPLRNGGAPQ